MPLGKHFELVLENLLSLRTTLNHVNDTLFIRCSKQKRTFWAIGKHSFAFLNKLLEGAQMYDSVS